MKVTAQFLKWLMSVVLVGQLLERCNDRTVTTSIGDGDTVPSTAGPVAGPSSQQNKPRYGISGFLSNIF